LYCKFPVLGLRYDLLLFLTLRNGLASRLTVSDLCWPQVFKELPNLPKSHSLLVRWDGKDTAIFFPGKLFFQKKSKKILLFFKALIINYIIYRRKCLKNNASRMAYLKQA